MAIPLFSVRMYENDKIIRCYHDLNLEQVYDSIPIKDYTESMSRDTIMAKMLYLMIDESFSCCSAPSNKYVLISRTGVTEDIHIPVDALRIKLPPSPEQQQQQEQVTCAVFCLRGTKRFLDWLNNQLPHL